MSKPLAIRSGLAWSLVNNGLTQILTLAVFLITARFVSKEAFGYIAVTLVIVELYRQVFIESFGLALNATHDAPDEDYSAAFSVVVGLSLVVSLLTLAVTPFAYAQFGDIIGACTLLAAGLIFTNSLSRIHEAKLRSVLNFKLLAVRSIISILAGGGVGIFLATQGYGFLSLAFQQIVMSVVGILCLWTTTDWRPKLTFAKERVTRLAHQAKGIAAIALANFITSQSDILFSGYYLGPALTGVYNAAKRILSAFSMTLINSVGSVSLPVLARFKADPEGSKQAFLTAVKLTSMMTAPLLAGLSLLSHELIFVAMGEKWIDAAPILALLTITTYFASIGQFFQSVLILHHKAVWQAKLTFVGSALTLAALAAFGHFGLMALAVAYVARGFIMFPFITGLTCRLAGIGQWQFYKSLFPSCAASLLMYGVLHVIKDQYFADFAPWVVIAAMAGIGGIVYALALTILDFQAVKALLSQIKGRKALP